MEHILTHGRLCVKYGAGGDLGSHTVSIVRHGLAGQLQQLGRCAHRQGGHVELIGSLALRQDNVGVLHRLIAVVADGDGQHVRDDVICAVFHIRPLITAQRLQFDALSQQHFFRKEILPVISAAVSRQKYANHRNKHRSGSGDQQDHFVFFLHSNIPL